MPHIPRAVCLNCDREMVTERQGVMVKALAGFGPYYIIAADRLECNLCGWQALVGWAGAPVAHHFEEGFEDRPVEHEFVFDGERYPVTELARYRAGVEKLGQVVERLQLHHEAARQGLERLEEEAKEPGEGSLT